jgi:hypothetical protein
MWGADSVRKVWEGWPVLAKSYVNVGTFPRGEECSLPRALPRVHTDTDRAVFSGAGFSQSLFSSCEEGGAPECCLDCAISARKWAREQEEQSVAILTI